MVFTFLDMIERSRNRTRFPLHAKTGSFFHLSEGTLFRARFRTFSRRFSLRFSTISRLEIGAKSDQHSDAFPRRVPRRFSIDSLEPRTSKNIDLLKETDGFREIAVSRSRRFEDRVDVDVSIDS